MVLRGHRKSVSCVCISEDGKYAYTGGKDSSVIKCKLFVDIPRTSRGSKHYGKTMFYTWRET